MNDGELRELLKGWYTQIDNQFQVIVKRLEETSSTLAGDLKKCKYSVFYTNPLKTLRAGDLYFLGLNPGGDSSKEYDDESSPGYSEEEKRKNWCEYTDAIWQENGKKTNLQRRVPEVLGFILGELDEKQVIKDVFSTNMYFFRSPKGGVLESYGEGGDCLKYHKTFLEIVKPKIIICCGNGEDLSAYSILRRRAVEENLCIAISSEEKKRTYNKVFFLKWFFLAETSWGRSKTLVLGIPHLSRFSPGGCDPEFYDTLKSLIGQVRSEME